MKIISAEIARQFTTGEAVAMEPGRGFVTTFNRTQEWELPGHDPELYMRSIFRRLDSFTPPTIRAQATGAVEPAPRFSLWTTLEAIRKIGVDQAVFLALTGIAFTGIYVEDEELANALRQGFQSLLEQSEREGWKTPTDYLLSYTYHEQRAHEMTRQEAAEFASKMLGKPISMHAWRMRVDRWARDHSYPAVEHRKRSATSSSTL